MKYHALTNEFTVSPQQLKQASAHFFYAIKAVKETAGLPLHPYKRETCLEKPDFAMCGIIQAAKSLGIDLGAEFGNDIDSSNH